MRRATRTKNLEKKTSANTTFGNIKKYGESSSIHGVSYIFNQANSIFERLLWFILIVGCLAVAGLMIRSSYFEWQENKVITSLKTTAKPVTDLEFPAITICGAGLHMDGTERVLYDNFMDWDRTKYLDQEKSLEERFRNYMREVFFIDEKGFTIIDMLHTMIAPDEDAHNLDAVRRYEVFCARKNRRIKREAQNIRKLQPL